MATHLIKTSYSYIISSCLVFTVIIFWIMAFYPWMYVNYGLPTYLINTLYSYIMSSCLHSLIFWTMSFHLFKLAIIMWNCVMLSYLVSYHICEIVSCYPVWLDNINMNYFMPSFIPHYPLHLSIIQCLYFQLLFLFISHFNWREWWQYLWE